MRSTALLLAGIMLVSFRPMASHGGEFATKDDAKAMALSAAEYLKANGPEVAFAEFMKPEGAFHDRDLYVTVTDATGVTWAHGTDPAMVGKNHIDLTDADGAPFIRQVLAVKDQGWVDYKWVNPLTNEVQPKATYVVHSEEYWIGVGAYE